MYMHDYVTHKTTIMLLNLRRTACIVSLCMMWHANSREDAAWELIKSNIFSKTLSGQKQQLKVML